MKRIISLIMLLAVLTLSALSAAASGTGFVPETPVTLPGNAVRTEDLAAARAKAWNSYRENMLADETLRRETEEQAIAFGDAVMRYTLEVYGEKPENGYPLYIAMHGGGYSDTPDTNDMQWAIMSGYYAEALECGVYVAVRGVRDTWDTHFNPESYPIYDRLIRYMILTQEVDPDRVYLEGFSAGGDGVWAIAPRMADRFAAANMSSGHPNGVRLYNLYRLPMQLQAGEYDEAYDRNLVTAEYGLQLDELSERFDGFEHRTLIHYDCGHNYEDFDRIPIPVMSDPGAWLTQGDRSFVLVDSFPPDYMDAFVRDPLPESVIWDLGTRADTREVNSFYYLSAPWSIKQGLIRACFDRQANRVVIGTEEVNGEFSVLLNERMIDFARPVTFVVDGAEHVLTLTPDRKILEETTVERGDPNYQFEARVTFR